MDDDCGDTKREEKMIDYKADIVEYLKSEISVIQKLDAEAINDALNLLDQTRLNRKRVYVFGNGGSAATASHMQNDFNKGVSEWIEPKFRFQCLNDNIATVMAIANDISYDEIFRFQLKGQLDPGDVVLAISGSGNSKNVIRAVEYARSLGNQIIGVTGFDGGKLRQLSDISLHVPVASMQITEDVHMLFDHLMMSMFYEKLCIKKYSEK